MPALLEIPVRVSGIKYDGSIADGPGMRTVVFLQGCDKRCKGCHNPETWDPKGGVAYSVQGLADEIMARSEFRRVTISGGEPLLQPEAVLALIRTLKDKGYDVCVYTGRHRSCVPQDIEDAADYLKVGEFMEELKTSVIPYMGSSNQEFIYLNEERLSGSAPCPK
ncbi:ribonucleoside-triphosphate reductase activating, anaerobic [Kipferlia bialata]|uniref:Anaerobic ribonucleoside-triphosphate reductase-activating protein n=1 Tax=Kipferlia bialata TaxID=797122 RepID=A0A391NMB3_9EUKA|nr:ribonucleoside-triphosphate reductase activating, anaerobic [Kipferlia bialata]|eukprot:g2278.t1